jgi:hypothetical protein
MLCVVSIGMAFGTVLVAMILVRVVLRVQVTSGRKQLSGIGGRLSIDSGTTIAPGTFVP